MPLRRSGECQPPLAAEPLHAAFGIASLNPLLPAMRTMQVRHVDISNSLAPQISQPKHTSKWLNRGCTPQVGAVLLPHIIGSMRRASVPDSPILRGLTLALRVRPLIP